MDLFSHNDLCVEESFIKNRIFCSFATAKDSFTLGFINHRYSTPKSLLKSNELKDKSHKIDLVIRKKKTSPLFDEIIIGDKTQLTKYLCKIDCIISNEIQVMLIKK